MFTMNYIIFSTFFIFVSTAKLPISLNIFSRFENDDFQSDVQNLHKVFRECLGKNKISPKVLNDAAETGEEMSENFLCARKCYFIKIGMLNLDGSVNMENVKNYIDKEDICTENEKDEILECLGKIDILQCKTISNFLRCFLSLRVQQIQMNPNSKLTSILGGLSTIAFATPNSLAVVVALEVRTPLKDEVHHSLHTRGRGFTYTADEMDEAIKTVKRHELILMDKYNAALLVGELIF